jgi:hypothetical protein
MYPASDRSVWPGTAGCNRAADNLWTYGALFRRNWSSFFLIFHLFIDAVAGAVGDPAGHDPHRFAVMSVYSINNTFEANNTVPLKYS